MKRRIDVLIVDDEAVCRKTLATYFSNENQHINIVGEAADCAEAYAKIKSLRPDVVFLDVNMPDKSGFDLLDRFDKDRFITVLCSGDKRAAAEGFRRDVLYFLEKPWAIDDLNRCLAKVQTAVQDKLEYFLPESRRKVEVFSSGRTYYIPLYDIVMVEASGAYSVIHREYGQRLVVSRNIKSMTAELGEKMFCRIHNSYLVNISKIASCSFMRKSCVLDSGREVKMAVRRSDELRRKLEYLWGSASRTPSESDHSPHNDLNDTPFL
jgi:two-component system LytT family response regulator